MPDKRRMVEAGWERENEEREVGGRFGSGNWWKVVASSGRWRRMGDEEKGWKAVGGVQDVEEREEGSQ